MSLCLSRKTLFPSCTIQNPTRTPAPIGRRPGIAVSTLQPRCSLLWPRIQRGLPGSPWGPRQRLGGGRWVDILGAGPCAGEGVWVSGIESRARETRPRGRVWGGNPRPQLGAQPRTGVNTAVGSFRRFTSSYPRRADGGPPGGVVSPDLLQWNRGGESPRRNLRGRERRDGPELGPPDTGHRTPDADGSAATRGASARIRGEQPAGLGWGVPENRGSPGGSCRFFQAPQETLSPERAAPAPSVWPLCPSPAALPRLWATLASEAVRTCGRARRPRPISQMGILRLPGAGTRASPSSAARPAPLLCDFLGLSFPLVPAALRPGAARMLSPPAAAAVPEAGAGAGRGERGRLVSLW